MRQTGDAAPQFSLPDAAAGATVSLSELLANGPVLLAFFKVSCPVCQLTFPFLQRMSSGGLQIVGVSQDDARDTSSFNTKFGVTFRVLLDQRSAGYVVSNAYGISSVPTLFLIEPDGHISMVVSGFSKRDLETLGTRAGMPPFNATDRVPEFKPG